MYLVLLPVESAGSEYAVCLTFASQAHYTGECVRQKERVLSAVVLMVVL